MADDTTKHFYETHAEEYEKQTKNLQPPHFLELFIQKLSPHANVLDVGCAFGRDSRIFVDAKLTVTGVDYSSSLINRARELVPEGMFLCEDTRQLHFPPSSFDGIWANASLLHLEKFEMSDVLASFHSFLKENGVLAVGMKLGEGAAMENDQRYGNAPKFYAYYTEEELREILEHAHFSIEWLEIRQPRSSYGNKPILELIARKIEY